MSNWFKNWWKPKPDWTLACSFMGKWIEETKYSQSAAIYWCWYDLNSGDFSINVSNLKIRGNKKNFPDFELSEKFFKQFIFHKDYDGSKST